jgi:hypothetical protein
MNIQVMNELSRSWWYNVIRSDIQFCKIFKSQCLDKFLFSMLIIYLYKFTLNIYQIKKFYMQLLVCCVIIITFNIFLEIIYNFFIIFY